MMNREHTKREFISPAANVNSLGRNSQKQHACFRIGNQSQMMFHLCYQDNTSESIAYIDLKRIYFNPSSGIILRFHDKTELAIRGRNLQPLRDRLADHRVSHIEEKEALHDESDDECDFISAIEWIKTEEDS